jgi:hypothetical protein
MRASLQRWVSASVANAGISAMAGLQALAWQGDAVATYSILSLIASDILY